MNYLVIYDIMGRIIAGPMMGNVTEPVGVPFMWVEIPEGKHLVGIDVSRTEHTPIFEDLPKPPVVVLQEQVNSLNIAMAQILGM